MVGRDDRFADRAAAGVALGKALCKHPLKAPVVVLALPRGGVPVGYEVARALRAPLDVMVVRKVGSPEQPELAMGAVALGDVTVREPYVAGSDAAFQERAHRERVELVRREQTYRAGLPALPLGGKTVVLVDDGLATGCTMLAAIRAARNAGAARVVATAPVASDEAAVLTASEADDTLFLRVPDYLDAISLWYRNFDQTADSEVCSLLAKARSSAAPDSKPP